MAADTRWAFPSATWCSGHRYKVKNKTPEERGDGRLTAAPRRLSPFLALQGQPSTMCMLWEIQLGGGINFVCGAVFSPPLIFLYIEKTVCDTHPSQPMNYKTSRATRLLISEARVPSLSGSPRPHDLQLCAFSLRQL